jgi:hypothetical protein
LEKIKSNYLMVETDSLVSIEAGITTKRKQRHGEKFGE